VFRTVQFPHQGQIVTIDQLSFCNPDISTNNTNTIPLLGQAKSHFEDIGVGLLKDSPIIGVFLEVLGPFSTVNMIASNDPWLIPSPSEMETIGY